MRMLMTIRPLIWRFIARGPAASCPSLAWITSTSRVSAVRLTSPRRPSRYITRAVTRTGEEEKNSRSKLDDGGAEQVCVRSGIKRMDCGQGIMAARVYCFSKFKNKEHISWKRFIHTTAHTHTHTHTHTCAELTLFTFIHIYCL
uniref:LD41613p n=1 Tax=Drosophila melanogaster TaxID=7227 RepID=Q95RD6_DROME|nr:LD41613p [Drosophila melanogaster]